MKEEKGNWKRNREVQTVKWKSCRVDVRSVEAHLGQSEVCLAGTKITARESRIKHPG